MNLQLFMQIINAHVEYKRKNPYWNCNYRKPLKTKQILKRL